MNNIIELKNVYKHYITNKKNTILKKINYKFKKGLIYSLVGPSGSGKSTLLNLLSLIDKPSSGEILINESIIKFSDIKWNEDNAPSILIESDIDDLDDGDDLDENDSEYFQIYR